MIVSISIIVVSIALFLYWFRYTCLLILSAKTIRDYSAQIAEANRLSFLDARNRLTVGGMAEPLGPLQQSLDRDYAVLTYMLRHAAAHCGPNRSIETQILMIDFQIMKLWYALVRRMSQSQARSALLEMASIVSHLANAMGERMFLSANG